MVADGCVHLGRGTAYQCLGGSVKRMPVVSAELGVGAIKRGIPRGLGFLDAAQFLCQYRGCSIVDRDGGVPVPVRLARLVVLGRVL